MSAEFRQLPPLVCQRLVSLLEQLARRHSRQLQLLQRQPPPDGVSVQVRLAFVLRGRDVDDGLWRLWM